MAGSIYIDPQQLVAKANEIDAINNEMTAKLNTAKSQVDNLQNTWSSNAGDKIRQAMTDLAPKFEKYREVVADYVTFLKDTAGLYTTTDDTATTSVNQVAFK